MTATPLAADPPPGGSDGGGEAADLSPATPSQRAAEALLTETSSGYEP